MSPSIPDRPVGPYAMRPGTPALRAQSERLLSDIGTEPAYLLQLLMALQLRYGHVPASCVTQLAQALALPRYAIEEVIAFYAFLHDRPHGQYQVLFSNNIIDCMAGMPAMQQRLCQRLQVVPGQLRGDGRVWIDATSCIGMSDQGPAALVNGWTLTRLSAGRIDRMARLIERRVPLRHWPARWFQVRNPIWRRDWLLRGRPVPGRALQRALAQSPEALLEILRQSGLRGRGGAGFNTYEKWNACRQATGDARYVVCNADEGEPGTFKDRVLLQRYTDLLIEGMTLCGWVLGARHGFIYLRAEYLYLLPHLQATLARRRRQRLLGTRILGQSGFDFEIEIRLGAGAYICGEESALLESLEGKRGIPRIRPPFPVSAGLFGQPTVINNVETFCCVTRLLERGVADFIRLGTAHSKGSKLLAVSGDCTRPGVYEFPWGVTLQEVLSACGGAEAQAVQVGGAAGALLDRSAFGRRLAFEEVGGSGAVMVFGAARNLLQVVHNFSRFFAHESCGFCTPCRVGTQLVAQIMERLQRGCAAPEELDQLRELGRLMQTTSHCGLGKTAANAVLQSLDQYPERYRRQLHGPAASALALSQALAEARRLRERISDE